MATKTPGRPVSERAYEKARAMSVSTNDPKFNTPLIPASGAGLIIHASTRVNAPASLVFRTLRNTETWRDWNNFVPRVTIRSQPPEDLATEAEIEDLILNTSRLVATDSDLVGTLEPQPTQAPPWRAVPLSPAKLAAAAAAAENTENSRRSSVASAKSTSDGPSTAQRFAQTQAAHRASTASGMSDKSGGTPSAPLDVTGRTSEDSTPSSSQPQSQIRPASPVILPPGGGSKLVESSSPATGGVLIQHGSASPRSGSVSSSSGRKGSTSVAAARAKSSFKAMYGEPSSRLKVNTTMTFHCRMGLPTSPMNFKDVMLHVTEVSRPDDVLEVADRADGDMTLQRSTTHTLSRSGVYRIVWGTDHKADHKHPKFLLTSQWVVEVRPVVRGDGKEECEVTIWESMKGMSVSGIKKNSQAYLFEMFAMWVLGLRDHCEAFGGAVERRDFIHVQH